MRLRHQLVGAFANVGDEMGDLSDSADPGIDIVHVSGSRKILNKILD